ncbi:MAG: urease accessory protein UreD [Gammaproteobacteria bacterium]|nr:urease accessory protein UreD [Gammaproteobacteria bacterium]
MNAVVDPLSSSCGWRAQLSLGLRRAGGRTVLAQRRRHGPLSVQRPFYPEGDVCHVYLLHPPGGVVGGDALNIELHAAGDTATLVTTPGAAKFYRSAGRRARQVQRLRVAAGASLEWLPHENILFPGADVALQTDVELHGDARLALWEIQCLGRPVIDEAFATGRIDSRLRVSRDGLPLLDERLRVSADNRCRLSLMAGLPVGGTLLISDVDDAGVEACRDLLMASGGDYAAATLLDDLLVVRYLGRSTERARRLFSAVWTRLRPETIGRAASPPRIWAT